MKTFEAPSSVYIGQTYPSTSRRRAIECLDRQFSVLLVDYMQVHIFRGPGRIFGVTTQASGDNLPRKYAPWVSFKTIEIHRGEATPGIDVVECIDDLETYGVHVTDAHVRITEEAMR